MPKTKFIDFKAVKAVLTIEQVLRHYNLLDRFKRNGDNLSGPCPIHGGENRTQFRVSISKNIWNCFSECKHGGNTLDFIAKMEKVSIHAAALKAIEWFHLDLPEKQSSTELETDGDEQFVSDSPSKHLRKKSVPSIEKEVPNKPLQFRLEKLDAAHPYLAERGITSETAAAFGAGYCEKGLMTARIAFPIRNARGQIVAYAGRYVGATEDNVPKYKHPPGFRKSQELFNIERVAKEPSHLPLVIVEGFFDCMKLYQNGARKTVALMGSTMSAAQEELIRAHTDQSSKVIVLLDEDEAGRAGRDDLAVRLAKFAFVKVHAFELEGRQPENLSEEEVREITGGGQ